MMYNNIHISDDTQCKTYKHKLQCKTYKHKLQCKTYKEDSTDKLQCYTKKIAYTNFNVI